MSHRFSKSGYKLVCSSQSKVMAFGRLDPLLGHHFHLTMVNTVFHTKYSSCRLTQVFNSSGCLDTVWKSKSRGYVPTPGSATLVALCEFFSKQLSCPQIMVKWLHGRAWVHSVCEQSLNIQERWEKPRDPGLSAKSRQGNDACAVQMSCHIVSHTRASPKEPTPTTIILQHMDIYRSTWKKGRVMAGQKK